MTGSDFCPDHSSLPEVDDSLPERPFQKLIIRVAALVLLILFLIPFYFTLKTLYMNQTVEAQEAG